MFKRALLAGLLVTLLVLSACGGNVSPGTSSDASPNSGSDASEITGETSQTETESTDSASLVSGSGASGSSSALGGESNTSGTKPGKVYDTSGIVKDMKGRKVRLHSFANQTVVGPNDKHLDRMNAKIAAVEKQYNCDIVLDFNTDWGSIAASVMAGKPSVDIWSLMWNQQLGESWLPCYVAGMLQPLEPLKCFDFNDKKYQNPPADMMVVDGIHYGILAGVNVNGEYLVPAFQNLEVCFYRYDVLQSCGVTNDMMPDTLAKNGKWTWDNFKKICQKVRAAGKIPVNDYAGNGEMNQINLYQIICHTYGTDYVKVDSKTKKVTFNGGSETALEALDFYVSLVKDNLIDVPNCRDENGKFIPVMEMGGDGGIAFQFGVCSLAKWGFPRWGSDQAKNNWGICYLPKVKESDPYTIATSALLGGWSIPMGVKNPRDAATVMQALSPMDTDWKAQRAEMMMDYQMWLPDNEPLAESILRIENEMNNLTYTNAQKFIYSDIANGCGVSRDWLTHVRLIATGQESASSVIKSETARYNNLLKDLYVIR